MFLHVFEWKEVCPNGKEMDIGVCLISIRNVSAIIGICLLLISKKSSCVYYLMCPRQAIWSFFRVALSQSVKRNRRFYAIHQSIGSLCLSLYCCRRLVHHFCRRAPRLPTSTVVLGNVTFPTGPGKWYEFRACFHLSPYRHTLQAWLGPFMKPRPFLRPWRFAS